MTKDHFVNFFFVLSNDEDMFECQMAGLMFNRRRITLIVGVAIAILVWLSTDLFGMGL